MISATPTLLPRFIPEMTSKTVQENLGHATASFTLDVYGHVTKQMKQASSERMEAYIKSVSSK